VAQTARQLIPARWPRSRGSGRRVTLQCLPPALRRRLSPWNGFPSRSSRPHGRRNPVLPALNRFLSNTRPAPPAWTRFHGDNNRLPWPW